MQAMLRNKLKWPTQLKYDIVFLFFWNSYTNGKSNINLVQLFKYTLKHYVTYFYEYMCQRNKLNALFQKKFLLNNPLVQEAENVICFEL
jgi:hypothetical protein